MSFTIPSDGKNVGDLGLTDDLDNAYAALAEIAGVNILDSAYSGGADPTGSADSTAAVLGAISEAGTSGKWLIVPPGTYNITEPLPLTTDNLTALGTGRESSVFVQQTANTPVAQVSGHGQVIGGIGFTYATQRPSSETNSIAMVLANSVGSHFFDISLLNAAIGLGADPSGTNAPLFSDQFDSININGYSISAISIISPVGAYCTGSAFTNIYTTNNGNSSASPPIDLRYFSNNVFNQLNVEHAVLTTDAIRLRNTLNMVFNAVDVEDVTFNGDTTGVFGDFSGEYIHLLISGLRTQFCTFAGSASNCLFHNPSQWGSKIDLRGYAQKSNTVTTPAMYLTNLGSSQGVVVTATAIDTSLFTSLRGSGTAQDTVLVNRISGGNLGSPTMIASGVSYTNPYQQNCMVYVTAGTAATTVGVGGSTMGTIAANTTGAFFVPAGVIISLTYASGTPSWKWYEVP